MILFPMEKILPLCEEFEINLDKSAIERFNTYGNLLLEWNEKINLTAITEPEEIVIKHFYDSLLLLKHINIPKNAKLIDVGTGAGFPGMVIKIARPDINLTLLDGLNKRLIFLDEVSNQTGLETQTLHFRAEEGGRKAELREQFDVASARAVAKLNVLSEYCMPFVKLGGCFTALKGPSIEEEIQNSAKAISLLGGSKPKIICEKLPNFDNRTLCIIKKISQTPTKYPRNSGKIAKQPL